MSKKSAARRAAQREKVMSPDRALPMFERRPSRDMANSAIADVATALKQAEAEIGRLQLDYKRRLRERDNEIATLREHRRLLSMESHTHMEQLDEMTTDRDDLRRAVRDLASADIRRRRALRSVSAVVAISWLAILAFGCCQVLS